MRTKCGDPPACHDSSDCAELQTQMLVCDELMELDAICRSIVVEQGHEVVAAGVVDVLVFLLSIWEAPASPQDMAAQRGPIEGNRALPLPLHLATTSHGPDSKLGHLRLRALDLAADLLIELAESRPCVERMMQVTMSNCL